MENVTIGTIELTVCKHLDPEKNFKYNKNCIPKKKLAEGEKEKCSHDNKKSLLQFNVEIDASVGSIFDFKLPVRGSFLIAEIPDFGA